MIRVCNVWHADFALAAWDRASPKPMYVCVCMCVCDSLSQYSHQTVLSATYTPDACVYFVNVANHCDFYRWMQDLQFGFLDFSKFIVEEYEHFEVRSRHTHTHTHVCLHMHNLWSSERVIQLM